MKEVTKPILRILKDGYLGSEDTANVTVWNKVAEAEFTRKSPNKSRIYEIKGGCGQFIYYNFLTHGTVGDRLTTGLFHCNGSNNNHNFNDCYLEMVVKLTTNEFNNPLSDKYTNQEYVQKYVNLLNTMGLIPYIFSIDDNIAVIRIDYNDIEFTEKNFLLLNWQAIRNLHLCYTMHVPARFIELAELYPNIDLFLLFRIAYCMIPVNCILGPRKGAYPITNYNPFITADFSTDYIHFNKFNFNITSENLREAIKRAPYKGEVELSSVLKDNDDKISLSERDYNNRYKKLVNSTSAEELWTNIETIILKPNQKELKTNKTEKACQIS